jgi:hypothetical protein
VRRSWAPVGQTPVLDLWGRHRDKAAAIAALTVSPRRRRLGLYLDTGPERYITAEAAAGFVRELLRPPRGRVVVVWDNGSNHKGEAIRGLLRRFERLSIESLPSYAPALNPVEALWSHLKSGRLANFVPQDVYHMEGVVSEHLRATEWVPGLLRAVGGGSELSFPELGRLPTTGQ